MAALTIRNLPVALHRALKMRAARNGRSMEAEVRVILASAVESSKRVRIGTELHDLAHEAQLSAADVQALERVVEERRDQGPHEPIAFE